MKNIIRKTIIVLSIVFVLQMWQTASVVAQVPSPTTSPTPIIAPPVGDGVTLAAFLQEIVANFQVFKTNFINTVEDTLGGYFAVLAYILAWIIAIYYFIQQFISGEWDTSQIGRFTGSLVVCLLLLVFCGDLNGDGRRGDLVRYPAYVGYQLAFGEDPMEPTGSYINGLVKTQREKFNENYQKFIENKLMVKINDVDMPVRYPGMRGIQTVAAVAIGNPPKPGSPEEKELLSQTFWIGLLFQVMNFFRSIIGIIDFFLLVLYSIGILICSIIAPFMCCVFVNRDLRKRFTYPFFWTVFTVAVIFPAISQTARYFAYLSSNIALGTGGTPNYTFDAATFTIVANGDPTPIILVAVLMMLLSIVILVMSLILSYSFAQGKLVESVSGLIANTFAGISSVGLGALVSSYATRLQAKGETIGLEGGEAATLTRAEAQLTQQQLAAQNARLTGNMTAQAGFTQTVLNAEGTRQQTQTSALGSILLATAQNEATRVGTVNSALANYKHNLDGMNTEQKQAEANNVADFFDKINTAESRATAADLRLHPEKLGLIAENYQNDLNKFGVIGSAVGTILPKDTVDTLTRSSDVGSFGRYLFGNPTTGNTSNSLLNTDKKFSDGIYNTSNEPPVFQRSDGSMVNAITGEQIKQSPSIESVFTPGSPAVQAPQMKSGPVASFIGGLSKKERNTLKGNQNALKNLTKQDPNFLPTIQDYAKRKNLNSNDILNLIAIESSFNKTADNGQGYIGLGQVGKAERRSIGWSGNDDTDLARLKNMTPSQQLQSLVFPFMEKKLGKKLNGASIATLYAAWGSGHATGNPNAVHMVNGGYRSKAYNNNPSWDYNGDGKVQEWEFGFSPVKKLGAGILFDANKSKHQVRPVQPSVQITKMRNQSENTSAGTTQQSTSLAVGATQTAPQFYKKSDGITRINNGLSPADQKYIAQQEAIQSERQNEIAGASSNFERRQQIVGQTFAERRVNEQNFTQAQVDNAQVTAQISQSGINQNYQKQIEGSNTLFGYQTEGAQVQRDNSFEVNQLNYQTAQANAFTQFGGESRAAAITKQAGLESMYQRNMANLVQSVGNSVAHQLSELFERASRGL